MNGVKPHPLSLGTNMVKLLTWTCILSLIIIHETDMLLTQHYIGNQYNQETFPPMSWTIKTFGIFTAIWISRAIMYLYYWLALVFQKNRHWFYFLILVTILYYIAMIPWLFTLNLCDWPLDKLHKTTLTKSHSQDKMPSAFGK